MSAVRSEPGFSTKICSDERIAGVDSSREDGCGVYIECIGCGGGGGTCEKRVPCLPEKDVATSKVKRPWDDLRLDLFEDAPVDTRAAQPPDISVLYSNRGATLPHDVVEELFGAWMASRPQMGPLASAKSFAEESGNMSIRLYPLLHPMPY